VRLIAVTTQLKTGRGLYRLIAVSPLEQEPDEISLTIALERTDGVERVPMRVRVVRDRLNPPIETALFLARLAPWFEREFEQAREAALKSVRTEHKLWEITFDSFRPGPFTTS
jgi:hypothetical protein